MSKFELLTVVVAILAIIPGLVALVRQSQQRRRMDELEAAQLRQNRATADLHEKQLALLLENEKASARQPLAHVKLDLINHGKSYRFQVANVGEGIAREVSVSFMGYDPSAGGDYNSKFPAPSIEPGSSLSFLAAIYLDSPSSFSAVVSWTNPDGTRIDNSAYVAI